MKTPKMRNKRHLQQTIAKIIEKEGHNADLNDLDVSKVKDMSELFAGSQFNGDISGWDVSNMQDMRVMFEYSPLQNNEPKWYRD